MEEFPALPPHTSSLAAAMQQVLEAGEEEKEKVGRLSQRMREVSGERTTNNVMFFGHLRAGQVAQACRILEVSSNWWGTLWLHLPPLRLRGFPSTLATW